MLRDFHLDLRDSTGAVISPSEYFTNCLDEKRKSEFCQFFSNLDCATLVTPLVDETKLQGLVEVPWGDLRGEFRDAIQSTRRRIFRNLKIKKEFNGYFFIKYLENVLKFDSPGLSCTTDCIEGGWLMASHLGVHRCWQGFGAWAVGV